MAVEEVSSAPRCGQCWACGVERIGCGCDGAMDDGCFLCTPSRHERPPCLPPTPAEAAPPQTVSSKPWPPSCDGCRAPLTEPGGLAFSPPNGHDECTKSHLCVECYRAFVVWLSERCTAVFSGRDMARRLTRIRTEVMITQKKDV